MNLTSLFLILFVSFFSKVYSRTFPQYSLGKSIEDRLLNYHTQNQYKKYLEDKSHNNSLTYENECNISSSHQLDCEQLMNEIELSLTTIGNLRPYLNSLRKELWEFIDERGDIYPHILKKIDASLSFDLSGPRTCPSPKSSLPLERKKIQHALELLKISSQLERTGLMEKAKKLEGTINSDCPKKEKDKKSCWEMDQFKNIFYRNKYGLRIHIRCLTDTSNWEQFPTNSHEIIDASNIAMEKIYSCYKDLNPELGTTVIQKIKYKKPIIFCKKPSTSTTKECAHVPTPGHNEITLFAPLKCSSIAQTIFHELLHVSGSVDNLDSIAHGNSQCRSYDAVYHCSHYCFGEKSNLRTTRSGCLKCVSKNSSKFKELCGALPKQFKFSDSGSNTENLIDRRCPPGSYKKGKFK